MISHTLEAGEDAVAEVLEIVTEAGRRHGFEDAELATIKLICDELVSNIWRHAYGGNGGLIEFEVGFDEEVCSMRFADTGPEFDPTKRRRPDTRAPLSERPIGGLGVFFVREYADRFTYRRDGDRNVIEIEARIIRGDG